jgi:hypothetical protein
MVGSKDGFRVGESGRVDDISVEGIESTKIYEVP